jgi:hypothetical protein
VARDLGPRVGDELLGAVHDPGAVLQARPGADVARVRAGLGLGEPEGAELAPRAQVGQPALALLGRAEEVDRLGAQRGVRAHRDGHGGVDARELLDRQRVLQCGAAGPADVLGERDPHPAQLAHPAHELVGEGLRAVELLGDRRDLLAREVANGLLELAGVVGQVEVHGPQITE